MLRKSYWLIIPAMLLGILQSVARATPLTDPIPITFGTGNDVGASSADVDAVALGDLDNDGDLDVVSGSSSEEDYEVIAWQNDGSPFSEYWIANDIGSTESVKSIDVGDLDNDGYLDVVVGDSFGTVTVWENDGSPFSGAWTWNQARVVLWGAEVTLGDLDNDGFLDIACGASSTGDYEVMVFENDGSPFSGAWTQNNVGASSATVWSVAVGDLDHDGYLDIVSGSAAGEDYEIIAWSNDHTPFSGLWTSNDVGTPDDTVWSVALGDLDQDGDLDLVSGSTWFVDDQVAVWENDGTPFSGLWTENGSGQINDESFSVALGDLDNDSDLDIVAGLESGAGTEVAGLQNGGAPFIDDWTWSFVGHSDSDVTAVAVGDLDNDGDLDVVTGSDSGEDYEIIACPNTLLHGELPLGFQSGPVGTSVGSVESVAAGDLDHDGDLDLVSGSTSAEDFEVIAWQNDGEPFDGSWTQNDIGPATSSVYGIALGDLDHDGDLDVVSVGSSSSTYEIMVWQNDGTPFSDAWTSNNAGTSSRSVWNVGLGDLDHDGDLDLATVTDEGAGNEIFVWQNDGTPFSGAWTSNGVGEAEDDVNSLALGDLDHDGYLDIVTGSEYLANYELIAWQNDGTPFSGAWTSTNIGAITGTFPNLNSVVLGDMDKDGNLDVVSGGSIQGDYEVIAWQNDGTPFLGLWTWNAVGTSEASISSVVLSDMENDGDLDIASSSQAAADSKIVIWENDHTPFDDLWTAHSMGTAGDHLFSVISADLDHDGDLDLVTGSAAAASYEIVAWQNKENLQIYLPIIQK